MILYEVQPSTLQTLLRIPCYPTANSNYIRRYLCPPYNSCMPGNQGAMATMGIIGATREAN